MTLPAFGGGQHRETSLYSIWAKWTSSQSLYLTIAMSKVNEKIVYFMEFKTWVPAASLGLWCSAVRDAGQQLSRQSGLGEGRLPGFPGPGQPPCCRPSRVLAQITMMGRAGSDLL